MILCDHNVWLALALAGHLHHGGAAEWFETLSEPEAVLFCRATQQGFLRLLTSAAVLAPYSNPPLTNDQAWAVYEALLADFRVGLRVEEPPDLERHWKEFARRGTASPKLWMDAYLAAFARSGSYQMVTTDRAFSQFAGLDLLVLGG